jgi:hypothetical protein
MKLGRVLLVLSAGLVSGLMMVAVASGSQAQVTQKALEAPHPSGATKKAAAVGQVACASTKSCAAIGTSLYTELAGKWKATGTPVVPGTGGTGPTSLACRAAGRCEAVGIGGENHLVHLTENGRKWSIGELPLPANAAPIDPPTGPFPRVTLSCAGAGDCTAVGSYFAADHTTHAVLYAESNGTWGAPTDVPLPPDASTIFPPPDGVVFTGGGLNLVSCPSAGNCSAVGGYTRIPNGGVYPWVFDETGGVWAPAGVGLQLPAGASTVIDDRAGGASPFMGFSGLSCPSAGNCTAIGGYVESQPDFQGVIFTEHDGVWSNGVKAPAPAGAAHYNDPMELINPLNAVSCATANDCAAVGSFLKGNSQTQHGLLLAEHQGKWKATAISPPRGANARGGVYLTSVSCPSAGNCVAVGYYAAHGKTHGLVVRERGGKWLRAVNAALPKGAAPASKSHTFLNSVTCPSKSACEVGGSYSDRSGKTQGLLLALKLR